VTYDAWIASFAESVGDVTGKCSSATLLMVAAFPELNRVRGFVTAYGPRRPHWWCVAPDGAIIDPTAAQFAGILTYEEFVGPEPIGRCSNCGELYFAVQYEPLCSATCSAEYRSYLMDET
jgi:hypothetical protein